MQWGLRQRAWEAVGALPGVKCDCANVWQFGLAASRMRTWWCLLTKSAQNSSFLIWLRAPGRPLHAFSHSKTLWKFISVAELALELIPNCGSHIHFSWQKSPVELITIGQLAGTPGDPSTIFGIFANTSILFTVYFLHELKVFPSRKFFEGKGPFNTSNRHRKHTSTCNVAGAQNAVSVHAPRL